MHFYSIKKKDVKTFEYIYRVLYFFKYGFGLGVDKVNIMKLHYS